LKNYCIPREWDWNLRSAAGLDWNQKRKIHRDWTGIDSSGTGIE